MTVSEDWDYNNQVYSKAKAFAERMLEACVQEGFAVGDADIVVNQFKRALENRCKQIRRETPISLP